MAPSQTELERRRVGALGKLRRIITNMMQIVGVNAETVTNVTSTDFPGHYPSEDNAWSVDTFKQNFSIKFHKNEKLDASFSLIGIDASIANAFRRIMIAELPTVAIEYVFVHNNTSVMQDEVLAHRLGLIPLVAGKEGIQNFLRWYKKPTEEDEEAPVPQDNDTIVLTLKVACTRKEGAARGETDPDKAYNDAHVYAHQIEFTPVGRQDQFFSGENAFRPANPDTLIVKLRPGQEIDLEMHAIKGIGSDHAKFSPVATASYRLLPTITITQPIIGKDAQKFARCFPKGVIEVAKVTKEDAAKDPAYEGHVGEAKAVVKDTMKDTVSRECLRHEEFANKVKLGRLRDHFIFSVESTGQSDSDMLFLESVKTLKNKCYRLKQNLAKIVA